jgi:hypothetical protein
MIYDRMSLTPHPYVYSLTIPHALHTVYCLPVTPLLYYRHNDTS